MDGRAEVVRGDAATRRTALKRKVAQPERGRCCRFELGHRGAEKLPRLGTEGVEADEQRRYRMPQWSQWSFSAVSGVERPDQKPVGGIDIALVVGEEVGGGGEDQPGRRVRVLSVIGQQAWHSEVTGGAREVGGLDQSAGSPARMRAEFIGAYEPGNRGGRGDAPPVDDGRLVRRPGPGPGRCAARPSGEGHLVQLPGHRPVRSGPVADSTRCHTRGSGDSVSAGAGEWCALPRSLRDARCTIAARTSRWRNDTCPTASSTCAR